MKLMGPPETRPHTVISATAGQMWIICHSPGLKENGLDIGGTRKMEEELWRQNPPPAGCQFSLPFTNCDRVLSAASQNLRQSSIPETTHKCQSVWGQGEITRSLYRKGNFCRKCPKHLGKEKFALSLVT